ncbi:GTPase Era [Desulfosarcina ovata subsp. sediminis]|uniref:GTPase Era n=1 Tax=Desulfosarcina ovata subsp. sediminis TaxID=885957 RepID=A0A5K7ZUR5_9BACT|nr:GTPase Era [Desulfosarcina ovata]BBO83983.1 GTPase Era [Desulfosarcina ovata subsp. sediminis]
MNNEINPDATGAFRSGYVAILGAPNAGKSTLLNRMLGQKLSITSKKPQTTRNRILGVVHRQSSQMVFLDTPGIHRARNPLNTRIVDAALSTLAEVDLILLVVDAINPDKASEQLLLEKLDQQQRPVVLALNKIDQVQRPALLSQIEHWSAAFDFSAVVPVSAKRGEQVDRLLDAMEAALPPGPPFFPSESLTDLPIRFIAAEMIREKAIRLTGQEIPYAVAVTVDLFKEEKNGALARIHATIHVERDSQKGIVIGKNGAKLKQIGEAARQEIENLLATKVFLKLFVRVQKNWTKDTKALRKFGY